MPFKDKLIPIKISEIICFYSTGGKTCIYLENGNYYFFQKSLDSIISFLNPELFIRANRQFILSKEGIKEITVWFDNRLLINLKTDVPEQVFISKNKVSDFKNWLMS